MLIKLFKGSCRIKAEGRFPERILNIASSKGIYVYDVRRICADSLFFSVSKKGSSALLSSVPENLSLTLCDCRGVPFFWQRYKKRAVLISLPVLFLAVSTVFSLFIWKVEISGGEKELQKEVLSVLRDNGIYFGALKHKINQNDTKREAILKIDDLSWLWVDIRGTTASVKIQKRTPKPTLLNINEPADVISLYGGIVEKMEVYCGLPLVCEGMGVEKGEKLVSGVFSSENENIPTYFHHACAKIILRTLREKTVIVPKETLIKTPTGNKKSIYGINFKKNNIKFSLNSGISYAEYDKIEKKAKIPFLPLSFSRTDYSEVRVTSKRTDTEAFIKKRKKEFLNQLKKENMQVENFSREIKDNGDSYNVTFFAECLVRTDKEIPVSKGDTNGENY